MSRHARRVVAVESWASASLTKSQVILCRFRAVRFINEVSVIFLKDSNSTVNVQGGLTVSPNMRPDCRVCPSSGGNTIRVFALCLLALSLLTSVSPAEGVGSKISAGPESFLAKIKAHGRLKRSSSSSSLEPPEGLPDHSLKRAISVPEGYAQYA